jgi:hypothetical protein
MQVLLMDTPEGPQICPECRTYPLAGVTMHLAAAITIIITRPFVHTVAHRGMDWMTPSVALPFVRVQLRAVSRNVFGDECLASPSIRMVAHPQALLARLARDDTDDRGPIVGIGAMSFAFIGAPPGRIQGVAMRRAFFPPRFGTTRSPQRWCPP